MVLNTTFCIDIYNILLYSIFAYNDMLYIIQRMKAKHRDENQLLKCKAGEMLSIAALRVLIVKKLMGACDSSWLMTVVKEKRR